MWEGPELEEFDVCESGEWMLPIVRTNAYIKNNWHIVAPRGVYSMIGVPSIKTKIIFFFTNS